METKDSKKDPQVVDFTEKFKSQKELREYARAQFTTLLQANGRIRELETQNADLKRQLETASTKSTLLLKSAEEDLCAIEINRLLEQAKDRALTFEETKRMDLLVKNLYLAKSNATPDSSSKKDKDVDQEALVRLASLPDDTGLN